MSMHLRVIEQPQPLPYKEEYPDDQAVQVVFSKEEWKVQYGNLQYKQWYFFEKSTTFLLGSSTYIEEWLELLLKTVGAVTIEEECQNTYPFIATYSNTDSRLLPFYLLLETFSLGYGPVCSMVCKKILLDLLEYDELFKTISDENFHQTLTTLKDALASVVSHRDNFLILS